ncbi:hypothetical protein HYC85_001631 [Camellia sinensis]|uniref:14-3-3 domain-containing protein n=1 Tax=Camellia sinensis TaxID=4442 RepID=A0A7J7I5X0_CAMSI|nr:hypothetical protein HYC85_001631 [Camellia sinensis]
MKAQEQQGWFSLSTSRKCSLNQIIIIRDPKRLENVFDVFGVIGYHSLQPAPEKRRRRSTVTQPKVNQNNPAATSRMIGEASNTKNEYPAAAAANQHRRNAKQVHALQQPTETSKTLSKPKTKLRDPTKCQIKQHLDADQTDQIGADGRTAQRRAGQVYNVYGINKSEANHKAVKPKERALGRPIYVRSHLRLWVAKVEVYKMGVADWPLEVTDRLVKFNIYMTKLAQQANRYKDTVNFMEKLIIDSTSASSSSEPTIEERNLFSIATKKNHNNHVALVTDYKSKIESKLSHICNRHLIPSASKSESKVFYLKMKGDYYRYITEFKVRTKRTEAAKNTMMAYKAGSGTQFRFLNLLQPFPRGWVWHSISLFSATRLKVH